MRCAYCFYADEADNRETPSFGVMDRDTARILIEKAMAYAKKHCTFTFQGGEPTLAGLEYFKFFTETVRKCNKKIFQSAIISRPMDTIFKRPGFLF